MFGAKSKPPTRLIAGSGGCSSSLKKPQGAANASGPKATNSSTSSCKTSANRSSQSSLLATSNTGRLSASRSSMLSDTTTVSLSSSTKSPALTPATNRLTRSGSNCSAGSSALRLAAAKTGPSNAAPTSSSSFSSSASSASSSTSSPSSSATRARVPTLAMSLRDKDQQIKLLIKERDEQKFQAELMARRAEEWEEKFLQSEVERSHVTSEADDEVVELRRLTQELEDENKRLVERLGEREQMFSDAQFKLDELDCERQELKRELEDKEQELKALECERIELVQGTKSAHQVNTERSVSKAKYEREIEELKEKITGRDEQMMQLRSSLEMRKNEVTNLQARAADLERKLKIECERSERHLKRIDEINLELKAAEAKLATRLEENEVQENQVRQLRQELRATEEKLEQVSLARKKDVEILHNKLSLARRASSTTPTSPQPYKTPTPQDEIVRLQMEIRDLKDQLIDREAELDCNRRDIEVMRRKMETRTLEVDCNNQELARRCQDLLEQNRQSEETVKQLLKSTSEHSAQLMHATEDLKEANGKCVKLREEINELELKLDEQVKRSSQLARENNQLRAEHEEQVEMLRQQVESLNEQISDLCQQLDVQTSHLHKDREALADRLSQSEIDSAQLRHNLATAKQDLRSGRLQTQEVASERDRLRAELAIKEKYIVSRNEVVETMRRELEDCKKSLSEYKQRIEELRREAEEASKERESQQVAGRNELRGQLEALKRECQLKSEENVQMRAKCEQLEAQLAEKLNSKQRLEEEEEELKRFDEMRQKHSAELDALKIQLKELEDQLELERKSKPIGDGTLTRSSVSKSHRENVDVDADADDGNCDQDNKDTENERPGSQVIANGTLTRRKSSLTKQAAESKGNISNGREDYETQIEFLNSVVVDMQRKCDDYKNRLAQVETMNIMNEFDNLILSNQPTVRPLTNGTNTGSLRRLNNDNHNRAVTLELELQQDRDRDRDQEQENDNQSTLRRNNLSVSKTVNNQTNGQSKTQRTNDVLPNGTILVPATDQRPATMRRISGRPFCDICSVFDLHHTIYCPRVSEKLLARDTSRSANNNNNNSNSNNNNNNNIYVSSQSNDNSDSNSTKATVDQLFREYEDSVRLESNASSRQFASLRRPAPIEKPPRPYCDHCDLFGHTVKSCNSLGV